MEFKAWPKIPRLENEIYFVTEKIDGTNACIIIDAYGNIGAQSRQHLIYPGKKTDNYGFAQWVQDNKEELLTMGPGRYFGEWWGQGIQRGYDQKEKHFSLFAWYQFYVPPCCRRVPKFNTNLSILDCLHILKTEGSLAAPGYSRPEGLIVKTKSHSTLYKVILEKHYNDF